MKNLKMSYKLFLLKKFKKFMKERSKQERLNIDEKIMILSKKQNYNQLDIKKLKGYENRFRLRVGKYRIIYELHRDILILILIDGGNRGDIYK